VSYTLSPDNLPTQSPRDLIASRLHAVEQRIIGACHRAGRQRADVALVAVTKSVSVEVAALLVELGVLHLGESRPQELSRKRPALPKSVRWHLVGHLQRNKIERTLPVHLVHSVDRISLLTALDEEAGKRALQVDALLEVNASGERSKMGFSPEELSRVIPEVAKLKSVRIKGLMTMAAPFTDPQRCRPAFALLRSLREELHGVLHAPHEVDHLSMGMSNDFEVAIEEGATFVRLGSVLFEGLEVH
jgi:PLP dependent protein